MFKGKARAYTNIALIKYCGKKDEEFILPMNNSLSLTLDAFYTETEVIFSDTFTKDEFYLDGEQQDEKATKKISTFLDLVREKAKQRSMRKLSVKILFLQLLDLLPPQVA